MAYMFSLQLIGTTVEPPITNGPTQEKTTFLYIYKGDVPWNELKSM